MRKNNESEPTSGFIKPEEVVRSDDFTDLSNVANRGAFQLTRAKRHGRWWMLKGLHEEYQRDSIYRAFLEKEFEIASQLQHPMVVSVYSLEDVKGLGLCIVMEWIEGTTLREWLDEGGHTRKQRRHVANMLLEALIYVHSRQTQHRDLKPSNIMLTHHGQYLKLIDFGLSDTDSHAVLKAPAGTKGYMAPEGPSDIYSLGVILRDLRLGWMSSWVIRKCCAPLRSRYHDFSSIQKNLQRTWCWPRRILSVVLVGMFITALCLFGFSYTKYTKQKLQSVSDSLKIAREESNIMINAQKSKNDSLHQQVYELNQELQSKQLTEQQSILLAEYQEQQEVILQHQRHINEAKRQIDNQIKELGIEQIMDTLSCQINVPIPILTILMKMVNETEEPELKEYIEKRYREPCFNRFFSLPFN